MGTVKISDNNVQAAKKEESNQKELSCSVPVPDSVRWGAKHTLLMAVLEGGET